jgi:hypothetical protein
MTVDTTVPRSAVCGTYLAAELDLNYRDRHKKPTGSNIADKTYFRVGILSHVLRKNRYDFSGFFNLGFTVPSRATQEHSYLPICN